MPSLKASEQGLAIIKQARNEKGWTVEDERWLKEASEILEPNKNWEELDQLADGASQSTWKRFLQGKQRINSEVFKAFCQVLELNWREVAEGADNSSTPLRAPLINTSEHEDAFADYRRENKKHRESVKTRIDDLRYEQGGKYNKFDELCELLEAGHWHKADEKTLDIMLEASDSMRTRWLGLEDFKKFPSKVIRTLDQVWIEHSKNYFGFSVQKHIRASLSQTETQETWLQFVRQVGWKNLSDINMARFGGVSSSELLYVKEAKLFTRGFFPYRYSLGPPINRNWSDAAFGIDQKPSRASEFLLLHGEW